MAPTVSKTLADTPDAAGRKTLLELDNASHTGYAYDNANRLTTLTDESSNDFTFAYDNANRLTSRVAPNGVTSTYDYDGMSRLKRLKHYNSSTTLYDDQFAYNAANQISQIAGLAQTRDFTYDNINRLTAVTVGGSPVESYAYDAVGNRTSSHLSSSYTTGSFNRLTATTSATYTYNNNGSMTGKTAGSTNWTYGWNREHRMVSASDGTDSANYVYDAVGRRVKRTQGSTIEKYTNDGQDVVLDDVNSTLTKYQNGPGIDNKFKSVTGGTPSYFLQDHSSSTVALVNASGNATGTNEYDSFGNASNIGFASRYGYTGREIDSSTALGFYRARFYATDLGRFISEDPIGFSGNDINLYGYVNNGPTSKNDPLGLVDIGYGSPNGPRLPYSHFPNSLPDWCGPADHPFISWFVPDYLGGTYFGDACKNHDDCYSVCGQPKGPCDDNIRTDVEEICKKAGIQCPGYADKYYKGVSDYWARKWHLPYMGQAAYDSAQKPCYCRATLPDPPPRWQQTGCWGGARGC